MADEFQIPIDLMKFIPRLDLADSAHEGEFRDNLWGGVIGETFAKIDGNTVTVRRILKHEFAACPAPHDLVYASSFAKGGRGIFKHGIYELKAFRPYEIYTFRKATPEELALLEEAERKFLEEKRAGKDLAEKVRG